MSAGRTIAKAASFVAVALLVLVAAGSAAAAPGDVELRDRVNFAIGNPATPVDGFATGLAVRPDGKIIQAGQVSNGTYYDFHVLQFNPDGSFDTSFGIGGAAVASFGGDATVNDMFLQPDGKILVVGNAQNGGSQDLAVARFLSNGQLDTTFDSTGKLLLPIGTGNDSGNSIFLDPLGKIVAAGDVANGSNLSGFVVRFNADGSLDSTFHSGMPLITTFGQTKASIANLLVLPNDDIVVAGGAQPMPTSNFDFLLGRLMPNGSLDTPFGDGGILLTDFGGGDAGSQVVFDPASNRFYIFGSTFNGSQGSFALERTTSGGLLDSSFGSGGKVITPIGSDALPGGALLQPDGKVIGFGSADTGTNFDFGIVRYNADGTLDTSFGSGGKVTTDFSGGNDDPEGGAFTPDGKLIVGGSSLNLTTNHFGFAWARYLIANPPPPPPPAPPAPAYNEDQDIVIHNLEAMDAWMTGLSKAIRTGNLDGRPVASELDMLAAFKRSLLEHFPPVFGQPAARVYPALEDADQALEDAGDAIYYQGAPLRDANAYNDLGAALAAMKRAFPPDASLPPEATAFLNGFAEELRGLQNDLVDEEDGKQALNTTAALRSIGSLIDAKLAFIQSFPNVFGVPAITVFTAYEDIDDGLDDASDYLFWSRAKAISNLGDAIAAKQTLENAFKKTFVPYAPQAVEKFPLDVKNFATDGGTVRSEPDGNIGCPTRCSHDYDAGTKVGLRADPKPGYRFVRWVGGPCTGSVNVKTCTVVMNGPRTIRAEFEKIPGPCQCSSIAVQVKSYADIHGRPGNHAARLVLGLQWSMICSGGKGDKCRGTIKISPPKGTDLRLVSPEGDITCAGGCNAKVFTHHIGGARIEFRSAHDFLPDERANKTFNFKIEKFCLQNGKEKPAGTTTLTLTYNSLGELDKKHSNLSLDKPRPPAPIRK